MPLSGRIYLVFTPELCRQDPYQTLEAALAAGVDLVQWRPRRPNRDGLDRTRAICRGHQTPLIINDDVMLALRSEAAGAHVGQEDMPSDAARKLMFGRLLGVSTHNIAQIQLAAKATANYVGFGPCFPTKTKDYDQGVGMEAVSAAVEKCHELDMPMFAIGGITPANLPELYAQGVRRIAVSSYVLQHDDPAQAVRELREALP
jgi:thiamine-phosphate pyrophosphorylase